MYTVDLKELELLEGVSTPMQIYPPMRHLAIEAVGAVDPKELELWEGRLTSSQAHPSMLHLGIRTLGKEKG